jgi:ankyrin repeat protein
MIKIISAKSLRATSWALALFIYVSVRAGAASPGAADALRQAAAKGDVAAVAALLTQKPDVDARNADAETALMLAAQLGHLDVVNALLDAGANVNALNKDHQTALIDASDQGRSAVARCLLDKGADLSVKDIFGMTALLWATHNGDTATIQALLDKGADPLVTANDGFTSLMGTAHAGDLALTQLFLDKGNDINAAMKISGLTPLILATAYGQPEIVSLLLSRHADTQRTEKNGHTALLSAITSHHEAIIPLLRAGGAKPSEADSRVLLAAALNNHLTLVKQLLEIGGDVNTKDKQGMTALMVASGSGRTDAKDLPLVQALLDGGADPNAVSLQGITSLSSAALAGRAATTRMLLAHHANINSQRGGLISPLLTLAVTRTPFPQEDARGTVIALLDGGAQINAQDKRGQTALLQALFGRRTDLARLLLARGASPAVADEEGNTALMVAAEVGLPDVVRVILTKDHAVNRKDKQGRTALARSHGPITIEAATAGPPKPGSTLFSPNSPLSNDTDPHEIDMGRTQAAHILRAAGGKE